MNNIFISYAREDRASAQKLATALAAQAWNIFWDPKIPVGKTWRQVIGSKLETAQCLVVLWSSTSIVSDWVLDEAETGRQRGILIPIVIEEGIEPPLGFRSLQAADLSKWDGSETDEVFRSLISDITEILGPAAAEEAARLRQRQDEEEQKQRDRAKAALEAAAEEEKRKRAAQVEAERRENEKRASAPSIMSRDLPEGPVTPGVFPWKKLILIVVALVVITGVLMVGYSGYSVWVTKRLRTKLFAENQTKNNKDTVPGSLNVAEGAPNPAPPAGMVYVTGGEFVMGRDAKDGGDEYERPAHKVVVNPFFIDLYEVTSEDYKKCVDENKCQSPHGWQHGNYASGASRHPVTGVTWDQANAYARWAGKRLPTETEWEFAARGGDGRRYPWGNDWKPGLANADGASSGVVDVGFYKGASPFGAFDMVGNAWEWTASDLKAYPGGDFPGEAARPLTVIRGGTYLSNKEQATTSFRRGLAARSAKEYGNTGFRCAKDVGVK